MVGSRLEALSEYGVGPQQVLHMLQLSTLWLTSQVGRAGWGSWEGRGGCWSWQGKEVLGSWAGAGL